MNKLIKKKKYPRLTCAEQQEDLHAQVLVVGDLQAHELAGDLQHQLALVRHVGQLHPLPAGGRGGRGGGPE